MTIKLFDEEKKEVITRIQQFFYNERGEEIGYIAAETILDFIMKDISPFIYNKAIQEAQKLVMDRMQSLDDDLYAMKKPI